jgi:cytochrome c
MKKTVFLFIAFAFISCKKEEKAKPDVATNPVEIGKNLFEGKGTCTACHKPNAKIIGPSLVEISKIYKEKKASIVSFLKEESEPIVDPSQYEVMKTNFAITKTMSDEELKALEAYLLSF